MDSDSDIIEILSDIPEDEIEQDEPVVNTPMSHTEFVDHTIGDDELSPDIGRRRSISYMNDSDHSVEDAASTVHDVQNHVEDAASTVHDMHNHVENAASTVHGVQNHVENVTPNVHGVLNHAEDVAPMVHDKQIVAPLATEPIQSAEHTATPDLQAQIVAPLVPESVQSSEAPDSIDKVEPAQPVAKKRGRPRKDSLVKTRAQSKEGGNNTPERKPKRKSKKIDPDIEKAKRMKQLSLEELKDIPKPPSKQRPEPTRPPIYVDLDDTPQKEPGSPDLAAISSVPGSPDLAAISPVPESPDLAASSSNGCHPEDFDLASGEPVLSKRRDSLSPVRKCSNAAPVSIPGNLASSLVPVPRPTVESHVPEHRLSTGKAKAKPKAKRNGKKNASPPAVKASPMGLETPKAVVVRPASTSSNWQGSGVKVSDILGGRSAGRPTGLRKSFGSLLKPR